MTGCKQHKKVREDPMFRTRIVEDKTKYKRTKKKHDITNRLSEFHSIK